MPVVSVIIPTYNRLPLLQEAVASVLNQTFSDFELLIIDDGSTDGTRNHFDKSHPTMHYIYQEHSGVSAARNRGIAEAQGDFIAFLDSDDYWTTDKLAKHVGFMQSNSKILISQTEEKWIRFNKQVNPKIKHKKPSGDIFDRSLELCVVSPSSVMMRRGFFDTIGLFDEQMPACEDYDLWLRTAYRLDVPLISEELTVKRGGHEDQLSRQVWGLDRFRVYALQKLLMEPLASSQQQKTRQELQKKCAVLLTGARKRQNYIFAVRIILTRLYPGMSWGIIERFIPSKHIPLQTGVGETYRIFQG